MVGGDGGGDSGGNGSGDSGGNGGGGEARHTSTHSSVTKEEKKSSNRRESVGVEGVGREGGGGGSICLKEGIC